MTSKYGQIRDSTPSHVDRFNNQHCWKLFERRLILRETVYLRRAVDALKKAKEEKMSLPLEPKDLEPSLNRVEKAVVGDESLIRDTIDMVFFPWFHPDTRFTITFLIRR